MNVLKKTSSRIELHNQKDDTYQTKMSDLRSIDPKEDWQIALSQAIYQPNDLYKRLKLDDSQHHKFDLLGAKTAADHFRVFATESYLQRIELGNWQDPLLLQILPQANENLDLANYSIDPLDEKQANPVPGLLHKYYGRALMITNGHCAINCRFCFRKNFTYSENHYSTHNKAAIKDYLAKHNSISEIILSGGDPLLLNDRSFREIIELVESIPHIKRLRIHSRIPIVLPERITPSWLAIISQSRLKTIFVIHCNHHQEINTEVSSALSLLKKNCFSLLNQSVLLKGINDSLPTLIDLQNCLFENQVQSYYLHILDKVSGTAHFDIPKAKALSLHKSLQEHLPGYMVPKLVEENAHEDSKTLLIK